MSRVLCHPYIIYCVTPSFVGLNVHRDQGDGVGGVTGGGGDNSGGEGGGERERIWYL